MAQSFVILDDHQIVREGVRLVLQREPGWVVVGEADSVEAGVPLVIRLNPSCVIVDLGLPINGGAHAIHEMRVGGFSGRIVVLTGDATPAAREQAMQLGIDGFALKGDGIVRLRDSLIQAMGPRDRTERASAHPANENTLARLTTREIEVLRALADGQNAKEIAYTMGLSVKTVDSHRANLMAKLHVKNLADLTRLAIRGGLINL